MIPVSERADQAYRTVAGLVEDYETAARQHATHALFIDESIYRILSERQRRFLSPRRETTPTRPDLDSRGSFGADFIAVPTASR